MRRKMTKLLSLPGVITADGARTEVQKIQNLLPGRE